jgi:hypothetical protein
MKKVTDAELLEIQTLRETLLEVITATGELTLNKFMLQNQLDDVTSEITKQQDKFIDFQAKERVLFEKLQQTYGTGNINMETGEVSE